MTEEQEEIIELHRLTLPPASTFSEKFILKTVMLRPDTNSEQRPVYAEYITLAFIKSEDGQSWVFDGKLSEETGSK